MNGNVLITGCSTGIGRACASRLREAGWHVYAGVRREVDAEALSSDGLYPVILDVTEEASVLAAAEKIAAETSDVGLSGLVNNAGIAVGGPVELLSSDDLRRQADKFIDMADLVKSIEKAARLPAGPAPVEKEKTTKRVLAKQDA